MSDKIELSQSVAIAAAGNGAAVQIPYLNSAGLITAFVSGTFGGTSVKAQVSPDGTTWFDAPAAPITANGMLSITGIACRQVRVVASGGSGISITAKFCF